MMTNLVNARGVQIWLNNFSTSCDLDDVAFNISLSLTKKIPEHI